MLVYQKNMFWSLFLQKVIFVTCKLLNNASKSSFLHYYNGGEKHEGFVEFENAFFQSKDLHSYIRWSVHVTVDDVNFCGGLECVYVKYKSRASTARD